MSFAHNTFCALVSYYLIFLFIFLRLLLHVNHVQPVCTFLSRTVMLILIFNSTAYCHAHSFIFYILFFISYFLFILFYVYFPCVVFYNICTVHGADLTHISLLVIHSLYSRVCQWFSNLSWGPPTTAYFVCLSHLTHLIQLISSLVESARLELGVAYERDIQNMWWLGVPRTGLRTTGVCDK